MSEYTKTFGAKAATEGSAIDVLSRSSITGDVHSNSQTFQRVVVEEVVFDPTSYDDKRIEYLIKTYGLRDTFFVRKLPVNTILGRRVLDGTDTGENSPQYFFPFFSQHMMLPIKAGEHVWVFYEPNKENLYGFWMSRITEPRDIDDVNHTHADRKFHLEQKSSTIEKAEGTSSKTPGFDNGATRKSKDGKVIDGITASALGGEKAYEKIINDSDSGKISEMEDVPRYKKRPGDYVMQGSNNTLISLGTDRTGPVADYSVNDKKGNSVKGKPNKDKKGKAGAIDLVVGRGAGDKTKPKNVVDNSLSKKEVSKSLNDEKKSEGDPDFETDLGRIYLSMKSDVDKNFNVNLSGIDKSGSEDCVGVIKVDHVRIIARKSIKFLVQPKFDSPESECAGVVIKDNGEIVFIPSDSQVIKLGGEDATSAILCLDVGASSAGGKVTSPPLVTTMGGILGVGPGSAHGKFSSKVLIK